MKISELPSLDEPVGDEAVVVLADGIAQRVRIDDLAEAAVAPAVAAAEAARDAARDLARLQGIGMVTADFGALAYTPGPAATDLLVGTTPRIRRCFLTGKRQGMLCEAAAIQLAYGTNFVGANASTGALPAHWSTVQSVGAMAATTVAVVNGEDDEIDARILGVPATTGRFGIHFLGSSAGLALGDYVTGSFEARRVSTAATGVFGEHIAIYENPTGFVGSLAGEVLKPIKIEDDAFFGYEVTRLLSADASNVTHLLVIDVVAGVPVDVTYRIRRVQRVKGRIVTSHIRNPTAAPMLRVADAVSIKPALALELFRDPSWSIDIEFTPDRQATGSIILPSDNVGNGLFAYMVDGIVNVTAYRNGEDPVVITAGPALPRMQNLLRLVHTSNAVSVSINGSPFVTAAVDPLTVPGASWTCPVGHSPDVAPLGGSVDRLAVFPGYAFAVTPEIAGIAYDHFRRPDGRLGDAAYGRYIEVGGFNTSDIDGDFDPSLTKMEIEAQRARRGFTALQGAVDYAGFDVGGPIQRIMTRAIYDEGSFDFNDVGALIASPWGAHYVSQIVSGSLHLVWRYTAIDVAYFKNVGFEGAQEYVIQQSIPITTTPGTEFPMGWMLDGIGGIIVPLPDQTWVRVRFPAGMTVNGPFGIYEHFRGDVGGDDANTRKLRYIGVMFDARR